MVFTLDVATLAASQAANLRIVEVQAPSEFKLSCALAVATWGWANTSALSHLWGDGNSLKQLNLPQAADAWSNRKLL